MNWYIDKYFECENMKEFSQIIRSGYRDQDEEEQEEEDIDMYLPIL